MRFTKMQGLGNDYLYVYSEKEPIDPASLSVRLSDRHFGVGSDGMIWILPSATADFRMRIFNADGSEAKMCGNGIRCVGKYVYDRHYTAKTHLTIETLSGVRTVDLLVRDGIAEAAAVDMGTAVVSAPIELEVCGQRLSARPVSVGNPHAVFFVPDADAIPISEIGPAVERHHAFPGGVNAEFVKVVDDRTLRMRVWERGSGITLACGTGACASAAAAVAGGFCLPDTDIRVKLDGGELTVRVGEDGSVLMTGPCETVFVGETAD